VVNSSWSSRELRSVTRGTRSPTPACSPRRRQRRPCRSVGALTRRPAVVGAPHDCLDPGVPGGGDHGTHVAGAAALVRSVNPGYNANQLESALKRAADVPEGYEKTYYGSGYLNVLDAL
jgi:subtilisin family serine protease